MYFPAWFPRMMSVDVPNGTAAYAANDVIGGLLPFTGIGINRDNEKSFGFVTDLYLREIGTQAAACDVYLFHTVPTSIADNAAFALTAAELDTAFAKVSIASSDYAVVPQDGGGTIEWAHKANLNHMFPANDGNLYAYIVPTGTPTFAAGTALGLKLGVWGG
jgi:hypothetical protein